MENFFLKLLRRSVLIFVLGAGILSQGIGLAYESPPDYDTGNTYKNADFVVVARTAEIIPKGFVFETEERISGQDDIPKFILPITFTGGPEIKVGDRFLIFFTRSTGETKFVPIELARINKRNRVNFGWNDHGGRSFLIPHIPLAKMVMLVRQTLDMKLEERTPERVLSVAATVLRGADLHEMFEDMQELDVPLHQPLFALKWFANQDSEPELRDSARKILEQQKK